MRTEDLFQPTGLDVEGVNLPDTIAEIQSQGGIVAAMGRGRTNSEYRLSICWPNGATEEHARQ